MSKREGGPRKKRAARTPQPKPTPRGHGTAEPAAPSPVDALASADATAQDGNQELTRLLSGHAAFGPGGRADASTASGARQPGPPSARVNRKTPAAPPESALSREAPGAPAGLASVDGMIA